jgi:hypothetical protein
MSPRPGQVVCFESFRRERERRSARILPYLAPVQSERPESPLRRSQLTQREIDHRSCMLEHLTSADATALGGAPHRTFGQSPIGRCSRLANERVNRATAESLAGESLHEKTRDARCRTPSGG